MNMMHPHGSPGTDFSSLRFYIRRMDTSGYVKPAEVPMSRLPLFGFIYVTSGEVLVESEGTPFLCQPGHLLLVPPMCPFATRYYRDAVGYMGGFQPSALPDSSPNAISRRWAVRTVSRWSSSTMADAGLSPATGMGSASAAPCSGTASAQPRASARSVFLYMDDTVYDLNMTASRKSSE